MVKRKLDGAVGRSSADWKIRKIKRDCTQPVKNLEASTWLNPVLRQAGWRNLGEAWNIKSLL